MLEGPCLTVVVPLVAVPAVCLYCVLLLCVYYGTVLGLDADTDPLVVVVGLEDDTVPFLGLVEPTAREDVSYLFTELEKVADCKFLLSVA